MKTLSIFLLLSFYCFASKGKQLNKECTAVLLSEIHQVYSCGILNLAVTFRFGIIDKRSEKITDTATFYVLCPRDYGENFWVSGATYQIHYTKKLSIIRHTTIVDDITADGKYYKPIGVITKAFILSGK